MPPRNAAVDRLERVREPFLTALRVGASMAQASRTVGVPERTVQNWIGRGGREPDGPFGTFAADVTAARDGVASGPMERDELREVVAKAARGGSVQAMKLAHEILKSAQPATQAVDSFSAVDDLAAARQARRKGA